jgi:serine/threonine protein kinase
MVFVIDDKKFKIPDKWAYGILPVTEKQLRHEFDSHRTLARAVTPSSGFNVLKIFDDLAVYKPPLVPIGQGFKIGVYIMQSLPFPTLGKVLQRTSPPVLTPEVLANIAAIPRVFHNLHQHGYAHSDLHSDNIAFDPSGAERPIIALAMASSGIDALLMDGSSTFQSRCMPPKQPYVDERPAPCAISFGKPIGELFLRAHLLLIDEVSMVNRSNVECFDMALRDLMANVYPTLERV